MMIWDRDKARLDRLIGASIQRIGMLGEKRIAFETDRGVYGFVCEGDCCSESWIWHVNGVNCAIGSKVLKFEDIEMSAPSADDGLVRQQVDQAYCFRILTSGGALDVEFRNSSSGYYGGSIEFDRACSTLAGYSILEGDLDAGKAAP